MKNKLETLMQLASLLSEEKTEAKNDFEFKGRKIVILQRGWVYVGNLYKRGNDCQLRDCLNIRKWGTTKGLGQLAKEGKQNDTILDKTPDISFHELTVINFINVEKDVI